MRYLSSSPLARQVDLNYVALRASDYSYKQLADIYNATRIDYIVPMPMNARRMEEYILHYDVDLDASLVVLNGSRDIAGLAMLALRGERAWITRLGVIPSRRGHGMGQFMMEVMLEQAAERGARRIQLEVIRGNEPAYRLFCKMGFVENRELLVLRRPPDAANITPPPALVRPLNHDEVMTALYQRAGVPSWIDETASLINLGQIGGLAASMPSQATGWVAFLSSPFQLSHIVLSDYDDKDLALTLLYHLHTRYPALDTKLENLPAGLPAWAAFEALGYHEVFRRIEMTLAL